jgi:SAM-dependent methyltransferase
MFNDVPELYDRLRPPYPDPLFADLAAIADLRSGGTVLEIGAGTGQATRSLAAHGWRVTALEPGPATAALARERLADAPAAEVVESTFEDWSDGGRRFDAIVAASSWHWVDPAIGWPKAAQLLHPNGWLAIFGHVVTRRDDEPEVFAETADLHELYAPGNPEWQHPPTEDEAKRLELGWGAPDEGRAGLFEEPTVRWYPTVQRLDAQGFTDLLRTLSLYRNLPPDAREPLLDAIAERIRTRLDDHAIRRYLTVMRIGRLRPT